MDHQHLDHIREYIEDHGVTVTYKWLSREFGIPVNAAKKMLYAYSQKDSSVSATYMISGLLAEKGHEVCLVKDTELESMKEHFDEVMGLHIYSVKKQELKNSDSLFAADYDTCIKNVDKYSRWSPIDFPIQPKLHPVLPLSTPAHSEPPKKITPTSNFPKRAEKRAQKNIKSSFGVSSRASDKYTLNKNSSTIKALVKEERAQESNEAVDKEPVTTPLENKPHSVTSSKVARAASSPHKSPPHKSPPHKSPPHKSPPHKSPHKNQKMPHSSLQFLEDSDIDGGSESDKETMDTGPGASATASVKHCQKKNAREAKESKLKKGMQERAKKRKRIQELSSDEEKQSDQEENHTKKRRKRIKKLKSKMYLNEDGEMVTEKVWETDSTSASDVSGGDSDDKKPIVPPVPKPSTKGGKKKQSSLLMFAKKVTKTS